MPGCQFACRWLQRRRRHVRIKHHTMATAAYSSFEALSSKAPVTCVHCARLRKAMLCLHLPSDRNLMHDALQSWGEQSTTACLILTICQLLHCMNKLLNSCLLRTRNGHLSSDDEAYQIQAAHPSKMPCAASIPAFVVALRPV